MKKAFILLFSLFYFVDLNAQCQNPMNDNTFGQIHAAVASLQDNKDATIRNITSTNCLTSNQIGLFSVLYAQDVEKYNYFLFAKPYCSDPQNFINLVAKINEPVWKQQFVMACSSAPISNNNNNNNNSNNSNQQATAQQPAQQPVRSAPIVVNPQSQPVVNPVQQTQPINQNQPNQNTQAQQPVNQPNQNTQTQQPVNQPIVYVPGYQGAIGCPVPLSQNDFDVINQFVANKSFDSDRLSAFKQSTQGKCLTVQQIKTLIRYFPHESSKLDAAKSALYLTHDIENYIHLSDDFTFSSNKDEILKHYLANSHNLHKKKGKLFGVAQYQGRKGCSEPMSTHDFELILKSVNNETFDSKKITFLKTFLTSRCITVHQVEKIATSISADSYKMDFFKFVYPLTFDIDNFPRLETNLLNSSYKNEFKTILK